MTRTRFVSDRERDVGAPTAGRRLRRWGRPVRPSPSCDPGPELQGRGFRFFPRAWRRASRADCKPGSVPTVGFPPAGKDHSSRRRIAAPLVRSTRTPDPEGSRAGRSRPCPYLSLLREGLAPPPVTRQSRVGSYPTISPLPAPPPTPSLEGAEIDGHGRYRFCCAFPRVTPGRR